LARSASIRIVKVFVRVEERGQPARYVPFEQEQMRIGRRPDGNDVVLERKSVSRKHLLLARKEGRFIIADLQSAGGTFVNGVRITAPVVVRPGDRIVVGEYLLALMLDGPETQSAAFEERTPTESVPEQTDARDDVTFGDVGEAISLHHARGGAEWQRFNREVLQPAFANMPGQTQPASADVRTASGVCAASPRVFPGGDVGSLAVALAAGKLAEQQSVLQKLRLEVVFEEGLGLQEVHRFLRAVRTAAWDEKIVVECADVQVVEPGVVPGVLFRFEAEGACLLPPPDRPRKGDVLVLSGPCGAHGSALEVMKAKTTAGADVFSDVAVTAPLVTSLAEANIAPHHIAFPFRGGMSHALQEVARRWKLRLLVREGSGYLDGPTESAALRLDLDPLFEACAGRLLAVVAPKDVTSTVRAWQTSENQPVVLGEVMADDELGSVVIGLPTRYKPLRRYAEPKLDGT
jgi:hydrogenase expression/formation protein HypE